MADTKDLESDFQMLKDAITDLEGHGGDQGAIDSLKERRDRTGQVLNLLAPSSRKEKGCFFVK